MTIISFRTSKPSLLGIDQQIDTLTYEFFNVEIRDYDGSPVMSSLRSPGGAVYEEGWNNQLTVDELIVLLMTHGYESDAHDLINESVDNLPKKYGLNYTIDNGTSIEQVYARSSIVSYDRSSVKLSQRKISWPRANLTHIYEPVVTEVTLWQ